MRFLSLLILVLTVAPPVCAADPAEYMQLARDGDFYSALRMAKEAVEADPENADLHGYLAEIQLELTQLKNSRASIQKALEIAPDVWRRRAAATLARIEFFEGNDEATREQLRHVEDSWIKRDLPMLMDPPDMEVKRTKNYIVYADQDMVAKGGLKAVSSIMEVVYKSYSKVLPFKVDEVKSRVYVFGTTAGYAAFSQRITGDSKEGSLGYFSPSRRILVVNADPGHHEVIAVGITADTMDTMFHEGFHQFARLHAPRIAIWFNEGMAEYFGPSKVVRGGKAIKVGHFLRDDPAGYYTRYNRAQESVESGKSMPLAQFLSLRHGEFSSSDQELTSRNYAQAWSFMHFLLNSKAARKFGPKTCRKYFKLLREGHPVAKAHRETFGKLDLKKVDAAYKKYVKELE